MAVRRRPDRGRRGEDDYEYEIPSSSGGGSWVGIVAIVLALAAGGLALMNMSKSSGPKLRPRSSSRSNGSSEKFTQLQGDIMKVSQAIQNTQQSISALESRLATIENQARSMQSKMSAFSQSGGESKLDNLVLKQDKMSSDLTKVSLGNEVIKRELDGIRKDLDKLSDGVEENKAKIASVEDMSRSGGGGVPPAPAPAPPPPPQPPDAGPPPQPGGQGGQPPDGKIRVPPPPYTEEKLQQLRKDLASQGYSQEQIDQVIKQLREREKQGGGP
jgi:prefoldin subunit 5